VSAERLPKLLHQASKKDHQTIFGTTNLFKPHSARTGTVCATFGCSRASQSKRRCSLCDPSVV